MKNLRTILSLAAALTLSATTSAQSNQSDFNTPPIVTNILPAPPPDANITTTNAGTDQAAQEIATDIQVNDAPFPEATITNDVIEPEYSVQYDPPVFEPSQTEYTTPRGKSWLALYFEWLMMFIQILMAMLTQLFSNI